MQSPTTNSYSAAELTPGQWERLQRQPACPTTKKEILGYLFASRLAPGYCLILIFTMHTPTAPGGAFLLSLLFLFAFRIIFL